MRAALLVLMAVLLVRTSDAASDDSKPLEISEPRAMAERAMKYLTTPGISRRWSGNKPLEMYEPSA